MIINYKLIKTNLSTKWLKNLSVFLILRAFLFKSALRNEYKNNMKLKYRNRILYLFNLT